MASSRLRRLVTKVVNSTPNTHLTIRPLSCHAGKNLHSHSLPIDLSNQEAKRRLFNSLLYRSKQRGFLELDLVLGKWVENNIHSLDENRIQAIITVLHLENPDLWKWIFGQEQPPEPISINPVFAAVREGVMKNLESHSAPETRSTPGQRWVRGWDDIKKSYLSDGFNFILFYFISENKVNTNKILFIF